MCLMKSCGAGELSKYSIKQKKAMWLKTFGAISAFIVAIINTFISGFTESKLSQIA